MQKSSIIIHAGLQGVGKTAISKAIAAATPDSLWVSTVDIRKRIGMRHMLDAKSRIEVHQELLSEVQHALEKNNKIIIVDCNLFELYARYQVVSPVLNKATVHFISPVAPFPILRERARTKFTEGPCLPNGTKFFDEKKFDLSALISYALIFMNPVFLEEANDLYASVLLVDTYSGSNWIRRKDLISPSVLDFVSQCSETDLKFVLAKEPGELKIAPAAMCANWQPVSTGCIAVAALSDGPR